MNSEIDDLEGSPGDQASRRNGPANPEDSVSAVERKRSASAHIPAPAQPRQKTRAGASVRKRRKRFVL